MLGVATVSRGQQFPVPLWSLLADWFDLTDYNLTVWIHVKCAFFRWTQTWLMMNVNVAPWLLQMTFFKLYMYFIYLKKTKTVCFLMLKWKNRSITKIEYSPSNSAGPTPTMIMDSGSDAACRGDRLKDMNERSVQLTHSEGFNRISTSF